MVSAQMKYGALHVLYFFCTCAFTGFAAIFLESKGLSSTLIGVATGTACVMSVVIAPLASSALGRCGSVTLKRLMCGFLAMAACGYVAVAAFDLPTLAIVAVFGVTNACLMAGAPFLSQLAMEMDRVGMPVNFGLARGLGSLSYALAAVVLSNVVVVLSPNILPALVAVAVAAFVLLLRCLRVDGPGRVQPVRSQGSTGAWRIVFRQRTLVIAVLGFTVSFVACNCLTVYLADVVRAVGGTTSDYGLAVFCMAASELPVMALVSRVRSRVPVGVLFSVAGLAYLARNVLVVCASNEVMVFIGLLFQSLSYGLLTPLLTYYVSEVCGPDGDVAGQTFVSVATTGVGSFIGTLLGGVLQDACGISAMLAFVLATTVVGTMVLIYAGRCAARDMAVRAVD